MHENDTLVAKDYLSIFATNTPFEPIFSIERSIVTYQWFS